LEKPFVLVADDNEATCTLITALLHHDFAVETASDGTEAIARLKNRRYAVILVDLLMPYTDGYAVLDFLRAERPDLLPHTIVVTASLAVGEMERVRQYDVCDVIAKPFDIEVLQAMVKRCVAGDDAAGTGTTFMSTGMILLLADFLR
jgi:CheY-like chemotaxis protein